jgi:long-chain acyl-CoA synthetase
MRNAVWPSTPTRSSTSAIDSLEWLSLSLELESALGIQIAEQDFADVANVRDLLRCIEDKTAYAPTESSIPAMLARDEAVWLAPNTRVERLIATILYGAIRLIARLTFRLQAEGPEHLPAAPPYLIVPNHRQRS